MASKTLDITNNTVRYGECVYSVPNITFIDVELWKRRPRVSWRVIWVCAGLGLICWYFPFLPMEIYAIFTPSRPWSSFPVLLGSGLLLVSFFGLWDRTKLTFYTLLIETSGKRSSLFSSRDKKIILEAKRKIAQVMEDRSSALSYHMNLGDVINTNGSNNKIVSRTSLGDFNNL